MITPDRRTANLAFGIRLMPLDEQHEVLERMRAELDPPAGVTARLAGLPVLAADANAALASSWRRLGTLLAGLLAVGLVLLVVHRRAERAWVPLVPIALATGWSALVLFALRIPLNPMSATLGALVLALSTEFAVLLDGRYREERRAGDGVAAALRRTYRSTGVAVLASGATAIAGFAVLAASDVRMLREFGIVTVVDLSVSLLGVLAGPAGGARGRRAPRAAANAHARTARAAGCDGVRGCLARRPGGRRAAGRRRVQDAGDRWAGLARARGGDAACRRSRCRRRPAAPMPMPTSRPAPTAGRRASRPACSVRGPEILNVCELAERGPVVLAFLATRSGRCAQQVDVLDRIAPRHPEVRFAAVGVRGDHEQLRRTVRERGWRLPVGYDHDGAVANLYRVAVCPSITFARRGGEVAGNALEFLDERALAARVEALEAGRPLPGTMR